MFALAVIETDPVPVLDVPFETVSQLLLLTADQPHDEADAVTVVDVVPPLCATVAPVGEIVNEHVVPGCVIVNVWPATVTVPWR